jgi:hypothetical protein
MEKKLSKTKPNEIEEEVITRGESYCDSMTFYFTLFPKHPGKKARKITPRSVISLVTASFQATWLCCTVFFSLFLSLSIKLKSYNNMKSNSLHNG